MGIKGCTKALSLRGIVNRIQYKYMILIYNGQVGAWNGAFAPNSNTNLFLGILQTNAIMFTVINKYKKFIRGAINV